MSSAKPFAISKQAVWGAYQRVRANQGAAGVDGQTIRMFEARLVPNLYQLWNRLSSGSYFPPPVRTVAIPKASGGERQLGIPTVADRIAQMVVKQYLEPMVEPHFHPDSYGYRPGKSALHAVGVTRQRCWQRDWVLDLDIKGFFDTIPHDLLMRAVQQHVREPWVLLYIERWLHAPSLGTDGQLTPRTRGTPQGGVISPLLANLFLHYAFDRWMQQHWPQAPFARYADDIVVHCKSEGEAQALWQQIAERLGACGLELHPEKTRVVYCKDQRRKGSYTTEGFDFLGFTFRPRETRTRRGEYFISFSPAISATAGKAIRAAMRGWKLHLWSGAALEELAEHVNPKVRGWLQYYGAYHRSALYPIVTQLERTLVRWARRKYKTLQRHQHQTARWLRDIARRRPALFAHWQLPRWCRAPLVEAV